MKSVERQDMGTYGINMDDGNVFRAKEEKLIEFAAFLGLDSIAPGRYSMLFMLKLAYFSCQGVKVAFIVEELKALEGLPNEAPPTKPASQFTNEPLKGIWHKHFFDPRFMPHNILAQMSDKGRAEVATRILDPAKSPTCTEGMIRELAEAVTLAPLQERWHQGKLTGEWIVFAKHGGQNYYLTLATHTTEDQQTFDEIKNLAHKQFPFLGSA
ncbi:hypothetical protein ACXIUT_27130 [Achromobacter denitrificans]